MTDVEQATQEVAPEVVQTEAEQVAAPEAAESTTGQIDDQPAEGESEAETPESDESEDKTPSKVRRERRKAATERLKGEVQEAHTRITQLESEIQRLTGGEKQQPPKIDDFDDHDEYVAALSAHKAAEMMDNRRVSELQREADEQRQQTEALQRRQEAEARNGWAAQAEEARDRYADFDTVVSAPDVPITQDMAKFIGLSDIGADVAYHLGTNKEQALEIARMSPENRAGAMRMLEHFVAVQTPRPRTTTKAPAPVTPIRPKATATKKVEDMSMAEYAAARKAGKI